MDKACHPLKDARDFLRTACHPLKRRGRKSELYPVARLPQVHHHEPRLLRLSLPGGRERGRERQLELQGERLERGDREGEGDDELHGSKYASGEGSDCGVVEGQPGVCVVAVPLEQPVHVLVVGIEQLLPLPL